MILDFLRIPLKLRHFLVLVFLTPIIFFVGIGILAVLEPSDVPSLKEKPYECGRFGDKKMRIDRRYLFFASVEYQDVNYWEKGSNELHNTKGCNDQIGNATFLQIKSVTSLSLYHNVVFGRISGETTKRFLIIHLY